MAARKTKRSAPKKQSDWLRKVMRFPQTKGKTIETVEFSTELGYHCISVNFTDKTSLNFEIEARFAYSGEGEHRSVGKTNGVPG
jgi:hypothetical protein